jgi:hypothetical protein
MRLGVVLCKWPKSRPKGNINIGKNQMVRNVNPKHMNQLEKDIEREKKNIFYCMHPAVNVEKERLLYEQMDKEENLDDLHFKYEKAFTEATTKAPIRLNAKTYDGLNMTGTWQKF